jgi:hypothetical protein
MMRDEKIDILRFIGLVCIILAHVGVPAVIFQLRNFDVPLMILISGASYALHPMRGRYRDYIWKRIKRLVISTWVFLTVYFAVQVFKHAAGWGDLPGWEVVSGSYALFAGIGYVWIIRIFLVVAFTAPILHTASVRMPSTPAFCALLLAAYALYEVIVAASIAMGLTGELSALVESVLVLIPYILIFGLGLRLPDMSRPLLSAITAGAGLGFAWLVYSYWHTVGHFVQTQEFKYPPTAYYLSYAVFVSFAAWLASPYLVAVVHRLGIARPVMFVAQNSIWIYLWHIMFLDMVSAPFYIKFPVVFVAACAVTYVQIMLVRQVLVPKLRSLTAKDDLKLIFTG